jgi:LmbE family N-acetylglucosaminyl deacetylase
VGDGELIRPGGGIVVLSPHLDDAVFSIGATIAAAARRNDVRVVTVLAGDPSSVYVAGSWDRRSGFAAHRESVAARRREDARACALVGAEPIWLPFNDEQYPRGGTDADVLTSLSTVVDGADVLLVPGWPLTHGDHAWLTRLCLTHELPVARLGVYVEQPYACLHGWPSGRPSLHGQAFENWWRTDNDPRAWLAKARATNAYPSQQAHFPRRILARMLATQIRRGGERIALARALS